MKNYIMIENSGEADLMSFILMGASPKRNDPNKIGMFGTGAKHAIAWMLRNHLSFIIYSGNNKFEFITEDIMLKDKTFKRIVAVINDSRKEYTSMVTDLGELDWSAWKVVREIVCNAIDEGNWNIVNKTDIVQSKPGYTRAYLEINRDLLAVIDEWDKYFTFDREGVLFENEHGKIITNLYPNKQLIYRKGVLVFENDAPALFSYDLYNVAITEDRVIKDTHRANVEVSLLVAACDSGRVIGNILNAFEKDVTTYETKNLSFDSWFASRNYKFSEAWMDRIGDRKILIRGRDEIRAQRLPANEYIMLNEDLGKALIKAFRLPSLGDDLEAFDVSTDPMMQSKLDNIVRKMAEMKIKIVEPLIPCTFHKKDIGWMTTKDGSIAISENMIEAMPEDIEIMLFKRFLRTKFLQTDVDILTTMKTMLGDEAAFAHYLVGEIYSIHKRNYQ